MQFSATQIALLIKGTIQGDPTVEVHSFGKIEEAQKGQLSFLANPKYEDFLYTTKASIVIINSHLELKENISGTLIRVPDAYSAFATLLSIYQEMAQQQLIGIQQPSHISPTAKIGNNVYLGAFSYIGNQAEIGDNVKIYPQVYIGDGVKIGANTIIHPGTKVYQHCVIGKKVILHAGVVIGSDGFGFAPQKDGTYLKVPQIGNVIIEDQVEIGSNTTIDRATIGSTIIHTGAKLDNLIQVAHNVEIGQSTVIAAQTGISGSTKIGNRVMIGGQTGIVGHISIADGSRINAKSGVSKSMKQPNQSVNGTPAYDFSASLRAQAVLKRLPELEKRIIDLEKRLLELQGKSEKS
jgi:UDP-3-O-[3-hydroxymyristoyl] glucosamine N-acyltransferase